MSEMPVSVHWAAGEELTTRYKDLMVVLLNHVSMTTEPANLSDAEKGTFQREFYESVQQQSPEKTEHIAKFIGTNYHKDITYQRAFQDLIKWFIELAENWARMDRRVYTTELKTLFQIYQSRANELFTPTSAIKILIKKTNDDNDSLYTMHIRISRSDGSATFIKFLFMDDVAVQSSLQRDVQVTDLIKLIEPQVTPDLRFSHDLEESTESEETQQSDKPDEAPSSSEMSTKSYVQVCDKERCVKLPIVTTKTSTYLPKPTSVRTRSWYERKSTFMAGGM